MILCDLKILGAPRLDSDAEMDSSLGILSPSDMKTSEIMSMTASQASNQGWTGMNRSRTFTRELNDPKAEDDLIIEELEPKIVPKKHVKRFKLNTTQIEVLFCMKMQL